MTGFPTDLELFPADLEQLVRGKNYLEKNNKITYYPTFLQKNIPSFF